MTGPPQLGRGGRDREGRRREDACACGGFGGIFISSSHKAAPRAPHTMAPSKCPNSLATNTQALFGGAKSQAANLIILCRCVSCSRNGNKASACARDEDRVSVCSTASGRVRRDRGKLACPGFRTGLLLLSRALFWFVCFFHVAVCFLEGFAV